MIRSAKLFSLLVLACSSQFAFGQSAQTNKATSLLFKGAADTAVNSAWNGGTGNWSVAGDWTPNAVPNNGGGNTYNVTIGSGGTDIVNLNLNSVIGSLALGATTGSSTLQNIPGTGETLEVTGSTTVNSTGIMNFANSSLLKFDGGLTNSGLFDLHGGQATITGPGTLNSGGSAYVSGQHTDGERKPHELRRRSHGQNPNRHLWRREHAQGQWRLHQ